MLWPCLWSFHIFFASVVTFRPKHKRDYIFRLQSNEAWWDPKNSTNSKVQDSWQNSELLSFLPKLLTNSDSEQSLYFVLPGHAESCRWIGSGSVKIPEWATALTIICPPSHCKTRKMTNTWVIVGFLAGHQHGFRQSPKVNHGGSVPPENLKSHRATLQWFHFKPPSDTGIWSGLISDPHVWGFLQS